MANEIDDVFSSDIADNHAAMVLLAQLETAHPGLSSYVGEVAAFIEVPYAMMRRRFALAVERAGWEKINQACCDWEREGILPDIAGLTQDQVGALWENIIFDLILGECIGFFPPESTDLYLEMPVRCEAFIDVLERYKGVPGLLKAPYWKNVLYLNFPELYLEPLLNVNHDGLVQGCDIACGWGRASLTLHDYENVHVECCDLTQKNLDILAKLAQRNGLTQHVTARRVDVTRLPFDDNQFDFFLSFDIFEHLNDKSLDRCLREILRCAMPGAVLYTETPMNGYCLPVTHVQDFTKKRFVEILESCKGYGKCFKLEIYNVLIPNHFGFMINTLA